MPVPTTYSEADLIAFMLRLVSPVAADLGWTSGAPELSEAVTETMIAYGVSDIADATDIPKLRALARVEAWRAAVGALSMYYDTTLASGDALKLSQATDHAKEQLAAAEANAEAAGYRTAAPAALVSSFRYDVDPYRLVLDEDDL